MSPPPAAPGVRRARIPARAVVFLLAVGGAVGVWWWTRPAPAGVPPVPAELQDAEVREVIEAARAKVADAPRSAAAWGELGLAFLANQFDRDADRCFEEAARLDPEDIRWSYARGYIALKRDPANAVALLRQAVAGTTPGPEYRSVARLLLAEALLERSDLDEAERLFVEETKTATGHERATLGLGLVARQRGDAANAVQYLTEARTSPRSRKQATIQLAALARDRGDVAEADTLEKEAARLPADSPWPEPMNEAMNRFRAGRRARERTITELEDERRFAEAAAVYLKQIDEKPTVKAYCGAAVNLARVHDYPRALDLLQKAVRLDPEDSQGPYTIAAIQFTRAEEEQNRSPGSADAKAWFREAAAEARRATELKPDHAQAYRLWGLALKHLGEPAAAIEPLRKGVSCRPELMALQLALGEVLQEAGRTGEAVAQFETASRLDPTDPRPAVALSRIRKK